MGKRYVARDQLGHVYWGLEHPRKDLMERLCCKHAEKMFQDTPQGPRHIGYVIAGLWLRVYQLEEWER